MSDDKGEPSKASPPHYISQFDKLVNPLTRIRAEIEVMKSYDGMLRTSDTFRDFGRQQEALLAAVRSANALYDVPRYRDVFRHLFEIGKLPNLPQQLQDLMQGQRLVWERLTQPNESFLAAVRAVEAANDYSRIAKASLAWQDSIATLDRWQHAADLFSNRADLTARLLAPSLAFTEFVQNTAERIELTEDPATRRALDGSLTIAEAQLLVTTDEMVGIVAAPDDSDIPLPSRSQNALLLQQVELLGRSDIGDDEDTVRLVDRSPTAHTAGVAQRVLRLITSCNEASKIANGTEIFKPTTRLLEAFADLPWLVPVDKTTFGEFIDCLFFAFYEGAGDDKLRFLRDHGGVLDARECDFIWCVKHLRNKWLRHDADHGKESNIKKAWEELASQFQWLALGHYPFRQEHYSNLQIRLLEKAQQFLELILEGLAKS